MTVIKNIILVIYIIKIKINKEKLVQFCFGGVMMAVVCHH